MSPKEKEIYETERQNQTKNKKRSKTMEKYNKITAACINNAVLQEIGANTILWPNTAKKTNTYTFRGPINISHLINDCAKDGKYAFIAVEKGRSIVGVSNLIERIYAPHFMSTKFFNRDGFSLAEIDKADTGKAIKFLETVPGIIQKQMAKEARKVKKNRSSTIMKKYINRNGKQNKKEYGKCYVCDLLPDCVDGNKELNCIKCGKFSRRSNTDIMVF